MLNRQKGNMYGFVTHIWNAVKGECPHGCHYCYMKRFGNQKEVRFVESELKTNLGSGNFIFVGSSCDMWAESIPDIWIELTLQHCHAFDNRYLFQSKNPKRIFENRLNLPPNSIICTTLESNRRFPEMADAPQIVDRVNAMCSLHMGRYETMITIEPIMEFDLMDFSELILYCQPSQVNIGANTNHKVKLSEPTANEVGELLVMLEGKTKVHLKPNLKRLMGK